jgi:hypothetical protein
LVWGTVRGKRVEAGPQRTRSFGVFSRRMTVVQNNPLCLRTFNMQQTFSSPSKRFPSFMAFALELGSG